MWGEADGVNSWMTTVTTQQRISNLGASSHRRAKCGGAECMRIFLPSILERDSCPRIARQVPEHRKLYEYCAWSSEHPSKTALQDYRRHRRQSSMGPALMTRCAGRGAGSIMWKLILTSLAIFLSASCMRAFCCCIVASIAYERETCPAQRSHAVENPMSSKCECCSQALIECGSHPLLKPASKDLLQRSRTLEHSRDLILQAVAFHMTEASHADLLQQCAGSTWPALPSTSTCLLIINSMCCTKF